MSTDKAEGISWKLFSYRIHWDKNQIVGHSVEASHTFSAVTTKKKEPEKPPAEQRFSMASPRNLRSNWTIPIY